MNAYRLPDDGKRRVINVSGGRSSAFMLRQILNAHGGTLPRTAQAVFCNTGKELPQTLDFVQALSQRWRVAITWLEFQVRKGKRTYAVVDHNSASRDGEPFAALVNAIAMLPTPLKRICTAELKVATVQRWAADEGLERGTWRSVIGLRYDESRRWRKAMARGDGCQADYPMVLGRATVTDVADFWAAQPFDLGIGSAWGNCDLCFLKSWRWRASAIRERPQLADWWIEQERAVRKLPRMATLRRKELAQFSDRHSYEELRLIATSNRTVFDDDGGPDCLCTD